MRKLFITPQAVRELDRESGYSDKRRGAAHERKYAKELRNRTRVIRKNRKCIRCERKSFLEFASPGAKGNLIIYTLEKDTGILLGVPRIQRELDSLGLASSA